MIDAEGYRHNVGIVLSNVFGQVLWAKRVGMDAWQFPQGGIQRNESPETAMYRELEEELGLVSDDVKVMASTRSWLRYQLPKRYIRHNSEPVCIGQKQIWYMLLLMADDSKVNLAYSNRPEFDHWVWVNYWKPVYEVVSFKRDVYRKALEELAPFMMPWLHTGDSRRLF
ncbi:MAG: RNA pyrophosphohydrolase [Gammaproteobacteria bacterium]|nr:RNA pyrophosphohydrolase [Gammaproteobacteria bacterium]